MVILRLYHSMPVCTVLSWLRASAHRYLKAMFCVGIYKHSRRTGTSASRAQQQSTRHNKCSCNAALSTGLCRVHEQPSRAAPRPTHRAPGDHPHRCLTAGAGRGSCAGCGGCEQQGEDGGIRGRRQWGQWRHWRAELIRQGLFPSAAAQFQALDGSRAHEVNHPDHVQEVVI